MRSGCQVCSVMGVLGLALGASSALAQDVTNPGDTVTPTSFNSPGAEGAANSIDNSANNKYLNFDVLNTGFTVVPGGSGVVRALTLITANDAPQRDPASYTLEGSDDGVNFNPISSGAVSLSTNRFTITQVPVSNSTPYLQYRVIFPTVRNAATANSMQIGEVQLNTDINILSPGDGISAVYTAGAASPVGQGAAGLIDRQLGVKFNVTGGNLGPTIANIIPAAGPTIVTGVELFSSNDDAAFPNRTPTTFTIEGSNDGTNYTQLFTVNPTVMNDNYLSQHYTFANTQSYTRYRVTLGASTDASMQLGEIQLFGTVGATPPSNDNCATPITVVAGATPGTTVNATGAAASPCGTGDTADVWFRYVATASGLVEANTCGAGLLDTTVAVFSACGGSAIGCNDNACGEKSRVRWTATNAAAYLIRVAGSGGATGGFTLTIDNAPVVHNDVAAALAYNFNGMVHQGEANDPDNPNGFRGISDRALRLTGAPGSIEVGLEGPTGITYQVVTQAGALDIVHLGDRNTVDSGNWAFDAEANGDQWGTQPVWLPDSNQRVPQTSDVTAQNLTIGAGTQIGVLFNASNNGTQFDMTLGFATGAPVTVQLNAPDWFGNMQPMPPSAGVASQAQLGLYFGTAQLDLGTPDVDLNVVESVVTVQSLIDGGFGDITGRQLTSISFSNAASLIAGTAIYAAAIRDPQGAVNGACCCGSSCTITTSAACSGSNRVFVGSATACTPYSGTVPCCRANYNKSAPTGMPPASISVQDIFDFLTGYFSTDACANTNDSAPSMTAPNGISVQDIFDYLTVYFGGGCL